VDGPLLRDGAVDTHAHVFLADLPIAPGSRYAPAGDAPLRRYLDLLDEAGIAAALLVQPSFLGTDNRFMLDAVATAPDRLRAVAVVDPRTTTGDLAALRARGTVGIRLNLIGQATPNLLAEPWKGLVGRVAATGLFVEVHAEGGQWPVLLPALLGHDLPVVIDHFGRPQSDDPHRCAGLAAVLDVAAHPRVWIKLSAPYRFPGRTDEVVARLLDRAGTDRLLWGSDWPFTQHPEIGAYGEARQWLDHWVPSHRSRQRILCENPRRLIASA